MTFEDSKMSDQLRHDPDAWVDQYGDTLYRIARSRVADRQTAEDLVQETFVAALRGREGFQGRSKIRTWLVAILQHKITDHYRKTAREPRTEAAENDLEALFNAKGTWAVRPAAWTGNPQKAFEQKAFFETLYRCLADLPERLSRIFMLREMDGATTDEICDTFGVSRSNVWVILYRARMALRRCLEANWFEHGKEKGEAHGRTDA
jgi:RNA polymerase sigma-70 factor (ECF subfamily)